MNCCYVLVFVFVISSSKFAGAVDDDEALNLKSLPGHMKPFGSQGPFFNVPAVDGFPSTYDFFNNYVIPSIPVVMKGAAKISEAFDKWTDEYFINHKASGKEKIYAEARKKEDRQKPGDFMSFRKFVRQYIKQDIYMVNGVPSFLKADVLLPPPLNCKKVADNLADTVMWFSSGGTKSVLHNDDVDNINCLYRGNKTLTFVSPFQTDKDWYANVIDHPEGTYSDIDVDAVDYEKYPKLAGIKYGVVQMKQGDCLFIPYKWAHQVNSYGNNLAVNVWFNHLPNEFGNLTSADCGDQTVPLTLDQVRVESNDPYGGAVARMKPVFDKDYVPGQEPQKIEKPENAQMNEEEENETPLIISVFQSLARKSPIDMEDLKSGILMSLPRSYQAWDEEAQSLVEAIFDKLDLNNDKQVDEADETIFEKQTKGVQGKTVDKIDQYSDELSSVLYSAQIAAERDMIRKMVEKGDVNMEMARNIYGDQFLAGVKPISAAKEEL